MASVDPERASAERVSPVATADMNKGPEASEPMEIMEPEKAGDESEDAARKQDGVRQVEAITSVWSKEMLWVMFFLLWMISFIDSLTSTVQSALSPYVYSNFEEHGLLGTAGVVSTLVAGVVKLPLAKVINIWGRAEGFAIMVLLMLVGLVMKAACLNIEMYAAAATFYWVGHIGVLYVIEVVIADTTTLKNRMLMIGINGTPLIIGTFAGPKIAQEFLNHSDFRWAFGAFIIIFFAFAAPVVGIFFVGRYRAKKAGVFPERTVSGRNAWESTKYYFIQFDVVGMILTIAGFALILLPFSIATSAPNGWRTPYIIAMIVVGVVCLGLFVVWEYFFAPIPYLPFKFLKDRAVLGGALTNGLMFISIYSWDTYYNSYLQVVHYETVTHAGYINSVLSLVSAFIAPLAGYLIRMRGTFKWETIVISIPFCVLGTALLIYFRHPGTTVGYLIMCQIFNGIASGFFSTGLFIAVMSTVTHNEIAVVLAIIGLFGSIGAALGQSISGAIWTNLTLHQLEKLLPPESVADAAKIFGSLEVQTSYPKGSATRDAIIAAYGYSQRRMVIAGAAFIPVLFISMLMWHNTDVKNLEEKDDKKHKQTKGNVF